MDGPRVQVYRNIHKSRAAGRPVYSIRDARTRRVVGHAHLVALADAVFHVSEAGRQRVLREERKNVHAWVEGTMCGRSGDRDTAVRVSYNPYRGPDFTAADPATGRFDPVRAAELVVLAEQVLAWGVEATRITGDAE